MKREYTSETLSREYSVSRFALALPGVIALVSLPHLAAAQAPGPNAGSHTWLEWRGYLTEFAPKLFQ